MANIQEQQQPDWTQIPADLLISITKPLKHFSDYIHIRAVCHTWRSLLPPKPPHPFPHQLPWLLLPPTPPPSTTTFHRHLRRINHHTTTVRTFYNLLTAKIHSLNLPEPSYPRRICGSSSNGFITIVSDTPEIFCLNPLTKVKLYLSPLFTLPCVVSFSFSHVGREYTLRDCVSNEVYNIDLRQMRDVFVRKVILSPVFALGIVGCHPSAVSEMVFCEVCYGDDVGNKGSWNLVSSSGFCAEDVVYCEFDGLFYAVNKVGDVLVFDLTSCNNGNNNNVEPVIMRSVNAIEGDLHYVVKFEEELLLVSRHLGAEADLISYCEVYETVGFDVYRFREAGQGQASWERVIDLGDRIVFVGENSSLGLLASDFPGCKGNCIYFTDDHSNCNDVGIFDLSNGSIESLPCYPQDTSLPLQWAPPIWITPNPC